MTGQELDVGSGGYMPNGNLRLFDTSQPIDNEGYGTEDLGGDYGSVLIVQQTGGNDQWKANEAGGIITFEFASPMDEVIELGLLNVVEDVWVQATDIDHATRTLGVSRGGPGRTRT